MLKWGRIYLLNVLQQMLEMSSMVMNAYFSSTKLGRFWTLKVRYKSRLLHLVCVAKLPLWCQQVSSNENMWSKLTLVTPENNFEICGAHLTGWPSNQSLYWNLIVAQLIKKLSVLGFIKGVDFWLIISFLDKDSVLLYW